MASDSTHFKAWDQNIFTQWHSRYWNGKRGVLIYWTVEKGGAMAVHSQLLECSASEVHAMVKGAMRHGTDMQIEASYVDTHGQSLIGFGVTRLLGFDLLPRIKQINRCKLYLPAAGDLDRYPRLRPALTNPIRWELLHLREASGSGAGWPGGGPRVYAPRFVAPAWTARGHHRRRRHRRDLGTREPRPARALGTAHQQGDG